MGTPSHSTRKPSRQQLRALEREKKDAAGWIAALHTDDHGMRSAIRAAIGNRHVTRTELEQALGMSIVPDVVVAVAEAPAPEVAAEPERVTVQHLLISFAGAGTRATRSKDEAEEIAGALLDRARAGEDFDEMIKSSTDDSFPGIYTLCNTGVTPSGPGEHRRGGMVPAFGNVGFILDVGGIAMAGFDPRESPYGWHIIKRLA